MKRSFVLGRGPLIKVIVEGDHSSPFEEIRAIFSGSLPALDRSTTPTRIIHVRAMSLDPGTTRTGYEVGLDSQGSTLVEGEGALMHWLEGTVTRILFRSFKMWHLFHAGALALDDKGIIIPGARDAGKSTITAALSLDGFEYLSDEVAIVDDKRRLHPFPKIVSLESGGWHCIQGYAPEQAFAALVRAPSGDEPGKWYVRPSRVSAPGDTGHSIDFIILLRRGTGELLVPIPKTDAMVALVDQHMTLSLAPGPGVGFISGLVNEAACYALDASRLGDAVRALEKLVMGAPRRIT